MLGSRTMSSLKILPLLILPSLMLIACSEHKSTTLPTTAEDPALQTALDELKRLNSFTETGLNYAEYSERLLTAKGTIDVALQRTSDLPAIKKIQLAVSYYIDARNSWTNKIKHGYEDSPGVQESWAKASDAARLATEYAFADQATRHQIDAREQAHRDEESARVYAQYRAREQARMERDEKEMAARQRLQESKQSRKALLRYSAADGSRDSSQSHQLVMTDVDLQIPSQTGVQLLWFGDIASVERHVVNLYKIIPKRGDRIVLRFNNTADLASFEKQLPAALASWRSEFSDVAQ